MDRFTVIASSITIGSELDDPFAHNSKLTVDRDSTTFVKTCRRNACVTAQMPIKVYIVTFLCLRGVLPIFTVASFFFTSPQFALLFKTCADGCFDSLVHFKRP
jgi:hypothetical protein